MNHYAGFTRAVAGGHHAMLRFAEDGQAEPVLGEGGKPHIYPSELEAQRAVTEHLLRYFNGHLRRDGETISAARAAAERVFCKGKMIPVEKRAGKSPEKPVEPITLHSDGDDGDRQSRSA